MKTEFILFLMVSLLLVSCSTYSENELATFDQKIKAHTDSLGLDYEKLDNGLYVHILDKGNEDERIRMTDKVTFYYTGEFLNGDVFQEIPKEEALEYKVNELIIGWQEALMLLGEGGEIDVIIPPQLGYGSKNTALIPPNSILKYRLKVLEVR